MKLTLIRSATLSIELAGHTLLVDPQLDPAGAREAVPNTPNPRPTPLVDLPFPPTTLADILISRTEGHHGTGRSARRCALSLPNVRVPDDGETLRY